MKIISALYYHKLYYGPKYFPLPLPNNVKGVYLFTLVHGILHCCCDTLFRTVDLTILA